MDIFPKKIDNFPKMDTNRCVKICSTSLIIQEIPIKITIKYYLISFTMTSIKQTRITNAGEDWEEREPSYTVDRDVNWYSHHGKEYEASSKI